MTVKRFRKILIDAIERTGLFETDTIDMREILKDTHDAGFDDIIFVVGEDENTLFTLSILKHKA